MRYKWYILGDSNMKVIVSALSLALTVIASSLPAHLRIFDILHTCMCFYIDICRYIHKIDMWQNIQTVHYLHRMIQVQSNSSKQQWAAACVSYRTIIPNYFSIEKQTLQTAVRRNTTLATASSLAAWAPSMKVQLSVQFPDSWTSIRWCLHRSISRLIHWLWLSLHGILQYPCRALSLFLQLRDRGNIRPKCAALKRANRCPILRDTW